jgi:hypothetical protein
MIKYAEMCLGVLLLGNKGEKLKPNFLHVAVGSGLAVVIILAHFQLVQVFSLSAQIAITVFHLLFVFLLFPLQGPLLRKIGLLFAGNIVGGLWYLIRSAFQDAAVLFLGIDAFKITVVILSPIIDFIWIVSLWSLSLSVLASAKKPRRMENKN